jgi:hypothetical protein
MKIEVADERRSILTKSQRLQLARAKELAEQSRNIVKGLDSQLADKAAKRMLGNARSDLNRAIGCMDEVAEL